MTAMMSLVAVAGCSGGDKESAEDALAKLGLSDSPAVVLAVAIERPSAQLVVEPDLTSAYLRVAYAARGYGWADAQCAVERAIQVIGVDAFATLSVGSIGNLQAAYPDTEPAARECASPESLARLDIDVPEGEKRPATPATDVDGAHVRTTLDGLYRASAADRGLTATEADCAVDKILTPRSDDDLAAVVEDNRQIDPADDADEVVTCFSAERIDEFVPQVGQALLDDRAEANKEHDRIQAEINAQIDAMNASTTTDP